MDKKKVSDLAKAYSISCKKLVKDNKLGRSLSSPAVILVSLTVMNLVAISPLKSSAWGEY